MSLSVAAHPAHSLLNQKPLALSVPVGEIHVWQVLVADVASFREELWQTLNAAEKQKISKLQSEVDRTRSIASRGILRTILGWYLDMSPACIEFSYNAMGKPSLDMQHDLKFNVSHADDLLLYTFTFGHLIGIDVERVSNLPELHDLARSMFSPREQSLLISLPDQEKRQTFFRLWTLREAFGKMRGNGLTDEIRNVDILTVLNKQDQWTFKTFAPLPGYEAAVVVEGVVRRTLRFNGFSNLAS
jgi:4'-phosphopantetheinyl transferase